jgi:multicomponent Na+:H+ antiporter subunit F
MTLTAMLDVVSAVTLTTLAAAAALGFIRLVRGPTLPDRVIAIDLIGVLIVCLLVVVAASSEQPVLLDVAMVLALISFVGTVAYARYVERERS